MTCGTEGQGVARWVVVPGTAGVWQSAVKRGGCGWLLQTGAVLRVTWMLAARGSECLETELGQCKAKVR